MSQTEDDEVIVCNADIDLAADLKRTLFNFERLGAEATPAKEGTRCSCS